ncbi:MAG: class I SAM-dependent methyltransferase [Pseudanabaenaceae cyanobacterium]
MATVLRDWSYQYPWLYGAISQVAALTVGGEPRFRRLLLQDLPLTGARVLDLCCGGGDVTRYLAAAQPQRLVGVDASPKAIARLARNVPTAEGICAFAENLPLATATFDVVVCSTALHEMTAPQRQTILQEVQRVLVPGGWFALADFHRPQQPWFWPPLALFLALFETETAWELLTVDLPAALTEVGLHNIHQRLYAGGSLQVVRAQKP